MMFIPAVAAILNS